MYMQVLFMVELKGLDPRVRILVQVEQKSKATRGYKVQLIQKNGGCDCPVVEAKVFIFWK
jgi:hypothetical protein